MKRRIVFVVMLAMAVVGGLVAAPRRYEVDGVSMGPGLLPGDVVASGWLPECDRWRQPRRFDRWIVTLPDGTTGLKRLVGQPGETVSLAAGDLAIDGRVVLKEPDVLAGIGTRLEATATPADLRRGWTLEPAVVLDDAAFALDEASRRLLPVHDVGFAAELDVPPVALASAPARLRVEAGPLGVTWRLGRPGPLAIVAGRLDGHAVAAAWRPAGGGDAWPDKGRCLPPGAPDDWDVVRPWPANAGNGADERSPPLALQLLSEDAVAITRIVVWRDILHRPAADGVASWTLRPGQFFLLGDFPSASRDSRHFGPLGRPSLRHRITTP